MEKSYKADFQFNEFCFLYKFYPKCWFHKIFWFLAQHCVLEDDVLLFVTWLLLLALLKELALRKLLDRVILGSGFELDVELLLLLVGMPMKFFKVDLKLPTIGMGSLLLPLMPGDDPFTGFGSCSSTISDVGMMMISKN